MNKKQFPFSTLTEAERGAILARAQAERARVFASAFHAARRLLARFFGAPATIAKARAVRAATKASH